MIQEINDAYIRERFGTDLARENVDALKGAMQKYKGNHWWESKDPAEVAKYQVFESIPITDLSTFYKGVEKLIGRPVYKYENIEVVRREAREAIARMEGLKVLDEIEALCDNVVAERELSGIKTLTDFMQQKPGMP